MLSVFYFLFFIVILFIRGGGGTPQIGYYYCVNMVVVSITAVLATTVIHVYVRGDRRQGVPSFVHWFFLQYLARLYCMSSKTHPDLPDRVLSHYSSPLPGFLLLSKKIFLMSNYHEEEFAKKLRLLKQRFSEFHHQQQQRQQTFPSDNKMVKDTIAVLNVSLISIENDLGEIRDYLRQMKKKVEDCDRSNKAANDWKQVALVLDRTFFFAYCCWLIISLVIMFPKTTNISKGAWSIPTLITLSNTTTNANNLKLT